jgi:hypothetical protein
MLKSTDNTTNRIFQEALQKHIDCWKSDNRTFPGNSTPDDVIKEVKKYDQEHQKSAERRYTKRFATIAQNFSTYFTIVDTCVSSNPEIAALIWGGLRLVIQVCC